MYVIESLPDIAEYFEQHGLKAVPVKDAILPVWIRLDADPEEIAAFQAARTEPLSRFRSAGRFVRTLDFGDAVCDPEPVHETVYCASSLENAIADVEAWQRMDRKRDSRGMMDHVTAGIVDKPLCTEAEYAKTSGRPLRNMSDQMVYVLATKYRRKLADDTAGSMQQAGSEEKTADRIYLAMLETELERRGIHDGRGDGAGVMWIVKLPDGSFVSDLTALYGKDAELMLSPDEDLVVCVNGNRMAQARLDDRGYIVKTEVWFHPNGMTHRELYAKLADFIGRKILYKN